MKKLHLVRNAKSVSAFQGGKRVAMCMSDDFEIVLKPRKNVQRRPLPVPVRGMFDSIIQARGRYDLL